jgi:hypothetical protein
MKIATQVYRDWSEGVINSLRADELPLNASPRGINSTLVSVAKGKAIVGKRRGASCFYLTHYMKTMELH